MGRFEPLLRRVASELELPEPVRIRILQELAADLEDLYAAYRSEGLPEEEAARRAEETLAPSARSLGELVYVHRPLYRRVLERLADGSRGRVERAVLFTLAGLAIAVAAAALAGHPLFRDPSPFLWPVAGASAGVLVAALAKLYLLYVRRDHRPGALGRGLGVLPGLGCAALGAAALGTLVELYGTARRLQSPGAGQLDALVEWVRRSSAMLLSALLVALVAALAWFVLWRRVQAIRRAEAEALGRAARADAADAPDDAGTGTGAAGRARRSVEPGGIGPHGTPGGGA